MNQPVAAFAARPLLSSYIGTTVLAIGAHPDDLELGVGGSLARLVRAGARVVMAVVSVPSDYQVRSAEARAAAEILGCELRILMGGSCRRIDDIKHYQLVGLLDEQVRELAPAAVITHSAAEVHGDHVSVYHASVSAQRLRFFDFFTYQPTMCRPVPMPFHPRAYVDVTQTIDAKIAAINAHASQFSGRGLDTEMFREQAHLQGRMCGVPYAEGLDIGRMLLA
jgi:LmbE family N-acetylglucosaminyl deacetylase